MALQPTFADLTYSRYARTTRRSAFLQEMDALLPWERWYALSAAKTPQTLRGRPPYEAKQMLRICLLGRWYALSDAHLADQLSDSWAMRQFAGLSLSDPVPQSATVGRFRRRIQKSGAAEQIETELAELLASLGKALRYGSLTEPKLLP